MFQFLFFSQSDNKIRTISIQQVEAELSQAQLHWRLALLEFHHFDEKLSISIVLEVYSIGGLTLL